MPKRNWLPAVLLFIAGFALTSHAGARAADKCLTKPNGPVPPGQHWYYHIDHAHKRQCWYLREAGLPVHQPTAKTSGQALPQAKPEPERQAAPPPAKAAQDTWKAPRADSQAGNHVSINAAPLPWFDRLDLLHRPPAAQASHAAPMAQAAAPFMTAAQVPAAPASAAASLASATEDPSPADKRIADSPNNPPPPADKTAAMPARKSATQKAATHEAAARRDPVHRQPPQAAPRLTPGSAKAGIESNPVFVLSMLLFAGLAVAGPLFHIVRRRRKFEAVAFRPPPWARVMRLNAPTPRARSSAEPPPSYPASPPLAPTEHTERLAQALQQLAERLRTHPLPSTEPQTAGSMPLHDDPAPDRGSGRPALADTYGLRGQSTTRRFS